MGMFVDTNLSMLLYQSRKMETRPNKNKKDNKRNQHHKQHKETTKYSFSVLDEGNGTPDFRFLEAPLPCSPRARRSCRAAGASAWAEWWMRLAAFSAPWAVKVAMGQKRQNPKFRTPSEHPNPTTEMGSKMSGESTYPKMGSHWLVLIHSQVAQGILRTSQIAWVSFSRPPPPPPLKW